jgi:PTH1 family peptidyl-tRNA hydrolase
MVMDKLAKKLSLRFLHKSSYHIARKNDELVLIKPMLYMNNSGNAVREYLQSSGHNRSFVVVYDDLALPLGKLRIREKGSDGGHKGLASIIYHSQTTNFPRLRIGIGRPSLDISATDYVLSKFSKEEKPVLEKVIETACQAIITIKDSGIKKAMNLYNALSLKNGEN